MHPHSAQDELPAPLFGLLPPQLSDFGRELVAVPAHDERGQRAAGLFQCARTPSVMSDETMSAVPDGSGTGAGSNRTPTSPELDAPPSEVYDDSMRRQGAEDVIPQVADMALQAEGAEWAVAAGIVGRDLVFSVRNLGYVRAAGDVVRAVVEGLGVGAGHRSMAKGIIPLKAFRKVYGSTNRECIREALFDAFVKSIRRDES